MSEITDLVVIEPTNALAVFKSADQIEDILQKVEREVMSFVPDVTTAKGRKEIASLAYKVAQTKTYLDGLGKDLVAELKEIPKLIDSNRKTVRDRLDDLKELARKPLTEYEAEQQRIADEKAAEEERQRIEAEEKAALEALRKQVESDHEFALLMDKDFDREKAEKAAEAERQRIAHEEELKRQAAEQVRREAEEKAERERAEAARREAELKLKIEQEERNRIEAELRVEREKKEAAERAEREKQEAIAAEQRKAQEEADRIRREAEAKEKARLEEEQRISDEAAARAANEKHRKAIGTEVVNALLGSTGISREQAIQVLTAIKDGLIPHTSITY